MNNPSESRISLRPIIPDDRDLLFNIYASTRESEMALLPDWPKELVNQFLQQQFTAQDTYYHQVNPTAEYSVILFDGIPGGRLYVSRNNPGIHVIDISLLPEFRNRGIGTVLLNMLMDEGRRDGKIISIEVEHYNPALHLYQRLGFQVTDDSRPIYMRMTWTPQNL